MLTLAPGAIAQTQYDGTFRSEELVAYELGYRVKPTQKISIDSTAFINDGGYSITISQSLSGYGGLTKFGTGTLEFDGFYKIHLVLTAAAGASFDSIRVEEIH